MTAIAMQFDVGNGVRRLLGQPGDVVPREPGASRRRPEEASAAHRKLYAGWLNDIRLAYDLAVEWWEGTVEAQMDEGLTREEATAEAIDARLAGPAAHPSVVYMVRAYWILCDDANREAGPEQAVAPERFLLGWLVDDGHDDLVKLLACMPYWPIGLDAQGNWC